MRKVYSTCTLIWSHFYCKFFTVNINVVFWVTWKSQQSLEKVISNWLIIPEFRSCGRHWPCFYRTLNPPCLATFLFTLCNCIAKWTSDVSPLCWSSTHCFVLYSSPNCFVLVLNFSLRGVLIQYSRLSTTKTRQIRKTTDDVTAAVQSAKLDAKQVGVDDQFFVPCAVQKTVSSFLSFKQHVESVH